MIVVVILNSLAKQLKGNFEGMMSKKLTRSRQKAYFSKSLLFSDYYTPVCITIDHWLFRLLARPYCDIT